MRICVKWYAVYLKCKSKRSFLHITSGRKYPAPYYPTTNAPSIFSRSEWVDVPHKLEIRTCSLHNLHFSGFLPRRKIKKMSVFSLLLFLAFLAIFVVACVCMFTNSNVVKVMKNAKHPANLYLFREPSHHWERDEFERLNTTSVFGYYEVPKQGFLNVDTEALYVHGMGENTMTRSKFVHSLANYIGVSTFAMEWPGFAPFSHDHTSSITTLTQHVKDSLKELDSTTLLLIGDDLGAVAIVEAVSHHLATSSATPDCHYHLVLRQPFLNVKDYLEQSWPALTLSNVTELLIEPLDITTTCESLAEYDNVTVVIEPSEDPRFLQFEEGVNRHSQGDILEYSQWTQRFRHQHEQKQHEWEQALQNSSRFQQHPM